MAMTAAGAAITGSVGMMVKSYVQAGDEVHKMALRTGFSTETLSELKYAAEISGASIETLEKGVKRMSKTIVDASEGMSTAVNALERIGLEAEELMGLSPEEQFDRIARAIASVEDPTIRAATAQDIFGRAGTQLLPLFAEGAEGLDALRKKAHELGIVFDQEAANRAAILNDSLTTLKGSFKGVTMTIAEALVPVITSVVGKISEVATRIKDWMKEHPKLAGTIVKVVVGLGGLMAILGPIAMILPALVSGVSMLGGAFSFLLGPIGLVTAAVAVGVVIFLKLKAAKDALREADERLIKAEESLREKLVAMKNAAGMTGEEFGKLVNKYDGNIVAMTMAIHKGKEGEKLQKALADVSKKHKKEIDKQRESYQALTPEVEDYADKLRKIPEIMQVMTDEINKLTMSEYEYAKQVLMQKYEDRKATIEKEIKDATARSEALILAEKAHNLEMEALDKEHEKESLERRKAADEAKKEGWQKYYDYLKEQALSYRDSQAEITDAINQITMSELEYSIWAMDQEKARRAQDIIDKIDNKTKESELLATLDVEYVLKKEQLYKEHAAKLTEIESSTFQALSSLYSDFISDTLGAFEAWGAGAGSLLGNIGQAFKNLASSAIQALKDIAKQELLAAAKTILTEKAKAIAKVITKVMTALPFPLNLAVVGGAIAAVTMLFKKLKVFKEGGFVPKETLAHLHPGEYVLNAPTVKALASPAGMTRMGTFSFNPTVNIYPRNLDDHTINQAAERLFAAMDRERRRRGL